MIENVVLVNELDEQIWLMEKLEAHEKGLLHRAFSLFIFNEENELLIQRRAKEKYHCWWLWTNTVCSHQRNNESTINASIRRVIEEMWFTCNDPKLIDSIIYKAKFDNWLTEYEYDHILVWKYNGEEINPNKEEVMDYKWISINDLKKDIEKNSNHYTPWMKLIIDKNIFYK